MPAHLSVSAACGWIKQHPRTVIFSASLLWSLCYPPFPFGWLAFIVLAPMFTATAGLSPGRAFRVWFTGGLIYNTSMFWWIYNVMKVGPTWVTVAAVGGGLICLIVFLSLFNGLIGLSFRVSLNKPVLFWTFPLAWAGLEALRAVGEMSFPWNNLGYTLGNWPVLIQSASLWGIYGISVSMVLGNLFLFKGFSRVPQKSGWILAWVAIPSILWIHGKLLLPTQDPTSPSLEIALVQPSILQTKKWDEKYFREVMGKTFRTLDGPGGDLAPVRGADLVVLAETAVPDFLRTRPALIDSLKRRAANLKVPILIGALDLMADRKPWRDYIFYNSAFLFHPDSERGAQQYSKLRLVPFSEKLPFDGIFPLINYVNLGEGDFSPGDSLPIWGDSIRFAPSICYEVIYPEFVRHAKAAGADFLINITNDGWFGKTNGPYQHANISRFRSVETGLPMARCANSGFSVFFDAWGRDLGRTRLFDSTVIRRKLPLPHRTTFYAAHGNAMDWGLLIFLGTWVLAVLAYGLRRKPINNS